LPPGTEERAEEKVGKQPPTVFVRAGGVQAVEGHPIQDVTVLEPVKVVMKGGQVVKEP